MFIKIKEENNNHTYRSQYLNYCGVRNKNLIIYGPFHFFVYHRLLFYLSSVCLFIYLPAYLRSMCKSVYPYISLYYFFLSFLIQLVFRMFFFLNVKSWPQDKLEQL